MKFFYADSLDFVDPKYNFKTDQMSPTRVRQVDDQYAHEYMGTSIPYDGMLISRAVIESSTYSKKFRNRLYSEGVQKFARFPSSGSFDPVKYPVLGDCGAFSYIKEVEPPYQTQDTIEFYERLGFTHGVSIDHIVDKVKTEPTLFQLNDALLKEAKRRYEITLSNADDFLMRWKKRKYRFKPIGIAQGWNPMAYQYAVMRLMKMGYDYIALGGLVGMARHPQKLHDIL